MPKLKLEFNYELSQEEVFNRVQDLIHQTLNELSEPVSELKENWHKYLCIFSFRVRGYLFTGVLTIEEKSVKLDLVIPFIALLYKQRIIDAINETANAVLAKAQRKSAKCAKKSEIQYSIFS